MPNIFRKLGKNANNFFKKTENGATNFFQKTIPDTARKIANTGDEIAGQANVIGRKVANTLEKVAPIVTQIGAATGQPELAGFGASLSSGAQQINQARSDLLNNSKQVTDNIRNAGMIVSS